MLQGWVVAVSALVYIGLLFAVASYGDRAARVGKPGRGRAIIYALSLAIYCTSWTFFGSVGLAAHSGLDFLPIYIGPILMFTSAGPSCGGSSGCPRQHNITSIADFIAARYGKSQALAPRSP